MLHQIVLQLLMSQWVSNLLTHSQKGSPCCWHLVIDNCKRTLSIIWFGVKHRGISLSLNDHVVQYHTTVHHLPHLIFQPSQGEVPDNSKSRLERTKCPIDILPARQTRDLETAPKHRIAVAGIISEVVGVKRQ